MEERKKYKLELGLWFIFWVALLVFFITIFIKENLEHQFDDETVFYLSLISLIIILIVFIKFIKKLNPYLIIRKNTNKIEEEPKNEFLDSFFYYVRGDMWYRVGEYCNAGKDYEYALEIGIKYNQVAGNIFEKGNKECRKYNYNDIKNISISGLMVLNPERLRIVSSRIAFSYYWAESYEKALEYFDKTLNNDKENGDDGRYHASNYIYRGNSKYFIEDYLEAIKDYDKVIIDSGGLKENLETIDKNSNFEVVTALYNKELAKSKLNYLDEIKTCDEIIATNISDSKDLFIFRKSKIVEKLNVKEYPLNTVYFSAELLFY